MPEGKNKYKRLAQLGDQHPPLQQVRDLPKARMAAKAYHTFF